MWWWSPATHSEWARGTSRPLPAASQWVEAQRVRRKVRWRAG